MKWAGCNINQKMRPRHDGISKHTQAIPLTASLRIEFNLFKVSTHKETSSVGKGILHRQSQNDRQILGFPV